MSRSVRPRAEVVELLKMQRQSLASSCEAFDKGAEWETPRLANAIFMLVHDGGSIISILTQLGVRGSLRFVSSGHKININEKNLIPETPLITITTEGKGKYLPYLDKGPQPHLTQFQTWWEKELIFKDNARQLTRRRLVFALRHQDGGGHVGNLTDETYVRFKTRAIWYLKDGNEPPEAILGAVSATMRQVAWEISKTLDNLGDVT